VAQRGLTAPFGKRRSWHATTTAHRQRRTESSHERVHFTNPRAKS